MISSSPLPPESPPFSSVPSLQALPVLPLWCLPARGLGRNLNLSARRLGLLESPPLLPVAPAPVLMRRVEAGRWPAEVEGGSAAAGSWKAPRLLWREPCCSSDAGGKHMHERGRLVCVGAAATATVAIADKATAAIADKGGRRSVHGSCRIKQQQSQFLSWWQRPTKALLRR